MSALEQPAAAGPEAVRWRVVRGVPDPERIAALAVVLGALALRRYAAIDDDGESRAVWDRVTTGGHCPAGSWKDGR